MYIFGSIEYFQFSENVKLFHSQVCTSIGIYVSSVFISIIASLTIEMPVLKIEELLFRASGSKNNSDSIKNLSDTVPLKGSKEH